MGSDPTAAAARQGAAEPSRFVVISGYHDYRSKRRANLHFIADELVKRGSVFFLSLRFSHLTRFAEDPRHELWARANRVESIDGVSSYLWRTPMHPFRLPRGLAPLERAMFGLFASYLPRPARVAIAAADLVFIESGIALVHLPLLRRLNPTAEIVYLASDALDAIGQADTIKQAFRQYAALIDRACLPSPHLRADIPPSIPCHLVPHGIDKAQFAAIEPSPYRPGTRNAVSVGSMLFDANFFRHVAPGHPEVTFHVIGSGHTESTPPNVIYYSEMPFAATLPFIKHADIAIAAYGDGVAPYLEHTSMKLMQYGVLGLPAVCPYVVAGAMPGRFGYRRCDPPSMTAAVAAALQTGRLPPRSQLGWDEVTARWIHPTSFADTEMAFDTPAIPLGRDRAAA